MAITIIIKQTGQKVWTVRENVLAKKTPTEIAEESSDYSGRRKTEIKFIEEFAVQEVEKTQNWEQKLLKQTIEDESKFDLAKVIKAINGL